MGDWQPQVVRIENIIKHPGADTLSIASVLGDYPVVIKTDEYNIGDLVGYIPIDTIVPDTEQFYFLSPRAYEKYEENGEVKQRQVGMKYPVGSVPENKRIVKAKKFFGVYSQGMIVTLPNLFNVGDSIIDSLGLKKHEEEEEDNLPSVKTRRTNAESPPKGWSIPHYDIESVRKYLSCLDGEKDIILSEKLHGSNSAFCHDGSRLWIKSRNYFKKFDPDDMWVELAIRYQLEEKLAKHPNLVCFGECIGQIKGFRYTADVANGKLLTKLYLFDMYDTKKMRYLDYDDFITIANEIGVPVAPLLYRGEWQGKKSMYEYAEGQSTLNPKTLREGWVVRPAKERYESRLESRLILKCVGEGYNLAK